ncbi:unnamed protein product [Colias eurytheme]|nr:unnamed protein product [Colias eurytheme]
MLYIISTAERGRRAYKRYTIFNNGRECAQFIVTHVAIQFNSKITSLGKSFAAPRGTRPLGTAAVGTLAVGTLAVGTLAVGTLAVGGALGARAALRRRRSPISIVTVTVNLTNNFTNRNPINYRKRELFHCASSTRRLRRRSIKKTSTRRIRDARAAAARSGPTKRSHIVREKKNLQLKLKHHKKYDRPTVARRATGRPRPGRRAPADPKLKR